MKTFIYKVYDASGNFLKTWDSEVISEPVISQEINTAGSDVVITLARNPDIFGEGEDVAFDNIVKIFIKDKEYTTPTSYAQGIITKYTPFYSEDSEGVSITILTFGDTLKDYIHSADEIIEQSQLTETTTESFSSNKKIAQSFIPDQNTINSVEVKLSVATPTTVTLYLQSNGLGNEPSGTTLVGSTVSKTITDTGLTVHRFSFETPVDLTIGDTYWIVVTA